MKNNFALSTLRICSFFSLVSLGLLLMHYAFYGFGNFIVSWGQSIILTLSLMVMTNIIYLYHLTRRNYGSDHSDDFFNFPVNFLVSMMTLVMVYQIGVNSLQSREIETRHIEFSQAATADHVIIGTWEGDPQQYPELNVMYETIMGHRLTADGKPRFRQSHEWAEHPLLLNPIEFQGNESQWHYAAQFCQQMVNIIHMFELDRRFKVGKAPDLELSYDSEFSGWITCFRLFLKAPIVRQVWETNKTRHGGPAVTAWVKYFVLDPIDRDPDFFIKHKKKWDITEAKYLKKQSSPEVK